jgi:hypothetical protein
MSLRRALLVVAALAAATFFLVPGWSPLFPSDPGLPPSSVSATSQPGNTPSASGSDVDEAAMSAEERRRITIDAMHDLLRAAQKQPGNLMQTLQQLYARCAGAEDCQRLIDEALAAYGDSEFASLVSNAIARMPLYDAAMQETVMSMETPPRERYAAIQALRQQLLGMEETQALFGQEAAWAEYQFRYGELLSDPSLATLPAEQRLAALDQLRRDSLGEYAEALTAVEGVHGRYERELTILTEGLNDTTEISRLTQQLRVTHFGAEAARFMAERDAVVNEQQAVITSYHDAVRALDAQMSPMKDQMNPQDWQALYEERITEIRLHYFP